MNRRTFIQQVAAGTAVFALPDFSGFVKGLNLGVVVHSYASRWNGKTPSTTYPGFANALDLLDHCHKIGAGGVQTVVNGWSADFAKTLRSRADQYGMYVEGSIGVPKNADDVARFEQEVMRAKEAGATVLRTVCSTGRRYEVLHSAQAFTEQRANALRSLQLAEPVLRKHKVKLGVENHKDWRATELVALLKQLGSEHIGVTLDFGNNMALLEDPTYVAETLSPYIFSTHVKDMGVAEYADGFLLSEVPLGQGLLDLPKLIELSRRHNPGVTFNLEMITRDPLEIPCLKPDYWATFGSVPGRDLANMLRLAKEQKPDALPHVAQLSAENRLAIEEQNIVSCLAYSRERLALN